ncbi:MAG: hypothetical protein ACYCSN_13905 [Acidobacteriaceae bacterium]
MENFEPWDSKLTDPDPRPAARKGEPWVIVEVPPGIEYSGNAEQKRMIKTTANAARAGWAEHGPAIKAAHAAGEQIKIPSALKNVVIILDHKCIYSPPLGDQYNLRRGHRKEAK